MWHRLLDIALFQQLSVLVFADFVRSALKQLVEEAMKMRPESVITPPDQSFSVWMP